MLCYFCLINYKKIKMKKEVLKFGRRIRLTDYVQGYSAGSIFIISSLHSDMQKSFEYDCYLESDKSKRSTFFDDEFEIIY